MRGMKWRMREMIARARGTRRPVALDREMDEEVAFHIEMATRRNIDNGLDPVEARRRALIAFGGVDRTKEEGREAQRVRWFENIGADARFAFRSLRKTPAFTAAALLTISIGIAANVSVFSVVNAVLLRPLPFPQARDVYYLGWNWSAGESNVASTLFQFDYMRRHTKALSAIALFDADLAALDGDVSASYRMHGMRVTGDFFRAIGIQPARGRSFGEAEARSDAAIVVLSDAVWRTRFAADPAIIGRTIRLNDRDRTVVGVMPSHFRFPAQSEYTDYIVPFDPEIDPRDEGHNSLVIVRARHGLNDIQVRDDISRVSAMFRREHPDLASARESFAIFTHAEAFAADVRGTLLVLLGAVVFVLLIGCANTANLMLVRATGRAREIAVRAALGAGRIRIVQQLLTEGIVLSIVAGIIGTVAGSWSLRVLLTFAPVTLARADEVNLDTRVLAFVAGVTIATGIVFGLAASLPAMRISLQDTLREGTRGSVGRGQRIRNVLVLAETAFAVVLLAGAGLLATSFLRLTSVDAGFDPAGLYAVRVGSLPADIDYEEQLILEDAVMQRIRALPGVKSAAVASNFPLERGINFPTVPVGAEERGMGAPEWRAVTPEYFATLQTPLKAGRLFDARDTRNSPRVAIVNEALAQRFWPGENPIGKRMYIGRFKGKWLDSSLIAETEVIGVTADMREVSLNQPPRSTMLVPRIQAPDGLSTAPSILVRARGGADIAAAVRTAVTEADPRVKPQVETMNDIIGRSVAEPRFRMMIVLVFAVSALILAAIGIYGVIAAGVQQSTREISVRIALGASRADVVLRVLRRCAILVGTGTAIGLALAAGLTRFLSSMLFEVTPGDPMTLAAVVAVLAMTGAAAGVIPAWRASRVDPGTALRGD